MKSGFRYILRKLLGSCVGVQNNKELVMKDILDEAKNDILDQTEPTIVPADDLDLKIHVQVSAEDSETVPVSTGTKRKDTTMSEKKDQRKGDKKSPPLLSSMSNTIHRSTLSCSGHLQAFPDPLNSEPLIDPSSTKQDHPPPPPSRSSSNGSSTKQDHPPPPPPPSRSSSNGSSTKQDHPPPPRTPSRSSSKSSTNEGS